MAKMMERFKNKKNPPKTADEHAEDALYREVWEEVHAQKTYDFVRKYSRQLIVAGVVLVVAVIGFQIYRHQNAKHRAESAQMYETAAIMLNSGNPAASAALLRAAEESSGGMSDLALFKAAMNSTTDREALLEKLSHNGATRDFRDLALVHLATIRGDKMKAAEFDKFMAGLQTKRSPYYFTGMLMVAQKYIADGQPEKAEKYISAIVSDSEAPGSIVAIAQMLSK